MMACINPVQQYQWQISDLFDCFLNSMKDSRARVEVDSQRHEGFCIIKITLWKCRSCPKHLYSVLHARTARYYKSAKTFGCFSFLVQCQHSVRIFRHWYRTRITSDNSSWNPSWKRTGFTRVMTKQSYFYSRRV